MSAAKTLAVLKRCSLKAARSPDGRTAAGAVREAAAALKRLGHGSPYSLMMAQAAARVGGAIRSVEASTR